MVDADGNIVTVNRHRAQVTDENGKTIYSHVHQANSDLFHGLKYAGSSFGIVTKFTYQVEKRPETLPVSVFIVIENHLDIERLGKLSDETNLHVSITRFMHFEQPEFSLGNIEAWLSGWLWMLFRQFHDVEPVVALFADMNTTSRFTSLSKVMESLERYEIKTAIPNTFGIYQGLIWLSGLDRLIPHILNYETNHFGRARGKQMKPFGVVSANQIIIRNPDVFETVAFDDKDFGVSSTVLNLNSNIGCQYCFWALLIHPRESAVNKKPEVVAFLGKSQGKRIYSFEFTCIYNPKLSDKATSCKRAINNVNRRMFDLAGSTLAQYANTPSCHSGNGKHPFYKRYWNYLYNRLLDIKKFWDPDNVFSHCHSLGSVEEHCCP